MTETSNDYLSGQLLASFKSYPSAGPPLSVENIIIVLLSMPRWYRARVTLPTESSRADNIADHIAIREILVTITKTITKMIASS